MSFCDCIVFSLGQFDLVWFGFLVRKIDDWNARCSMNFSYKVWVRKQCETFLCFTVHVFQMPTLIICVPCWAWHTFIAEKLITPEHTA